MNFSNQRPRVLGNGLFTLFYIAIFLLFYFNSEVVLNLFVDDILVDTGSITGFSFSLPFSRPSSNSPPPILYVGGAPPSISTQSVFMGCMRDLVYNFEYVCVCVWVVRYVCMLHMHVRIHINTYVHSITTYKYIHTCT